MALSDIIRNGKGRAHAWRVEQNADGTRSLWHYATEMLRWNPAGATVDEVVVYYSTGWGSVSDQQGMNKAFRELGLPLYYSRAGGAEIK